MHGIAKLEVVVQGDAVRLTLELPLESVIGFEHRPKTSGQHEAVTALQARMRSGKDLFAFDSAANCSLTKADAQSAIFMLEPAPASAPGDSHADLDAAFEFHCARPERLTQLDVGLFAAYPRLRRLAVEVVSDKGQLKRNLTAPARIVRLRRDP